GEYCDSLNMSKGEAKDYVYEKYDEWKNPDLDKLEQECNAKNGAFFGRTCMLCDQGEVVSDNKCVPKVEEEEIAEVEEIVEDDEVDEDMIGDCKYDSDCSAVCEGSVAWKMGCDPSIGECIKTFDTNCSSDVETFGGLNFPKVCSGGKCMRDTGSIEKMKIELQALKNEASQDVKLTNAQRQELQALMLDANKNCINGIADMTNVAIVEFGTRIASLMAGGLPSLADASVDYINDAINKLSAQGNANLTDEQKLKPDEYISLNCGLYNDFKTYLTATGVELDNELENAHEIDDMLQALP
ncbi:MAG: hypothetical protein U9Q12_04670, partial [Patescibacteria group bacterium]|nr:hypothetical protein [Patescibacteria group bacterium]